MCIEIITIVMYIHTDQMGERKWEDLEMDCLVNVLGRVGIESLLLDVPFVCKSWHKASLNPLCWKFLSFPFAFDSWSNKNIIRRYRDQYEIEELSGTAFIKFIVDRSCRNATKLVFPTYCTEEALKHAADECPGLEILGLPCGVFRQQLSIIPESITKWKNLKGLILGSSSVFIDLDECRSFEAIIGNEDASAIVTLLPKIKYLHLTEVSIDNENLVTILQGCKELVYLNVSYCEGLEVDDKILELSSHITTFKYKHSAVEAPLYMDDTTLPLDINALESGPNIIDFDSFVYYDEK
ncbi:F-box/LRR-repeat protein At3g48880-like isoform X1 [Pistacia vera]|uniref:F-box/LRR-repeat protein At3g48880-like isoform X1 n=2 Tax=Pistacia vera TaxID=55513 RepID=UPI00126343FE|nr:F-box/LRR-repeat protein At3g48880-like isoform X1 [Pistacia vera]